MATLALGLAGAALGGALLPSVGVLGATLTGAAIGQAFGALAGSAVDQALFGASGNARKVEGPRLAELTVLSSTEGAPLPRLYGRAKLGGQVIWATRLEEESVTTADSGGGGKGIGGGAAPSRVEYRYYANFAVGLCEGAIARVGRIWADGKEFDLSGIQYRVHDGSETQVADSLIVAKEGAANSPAYRGLAYVVFERLPLARFGNRIPQLAFEVFRPIEEFAGSVRAVTMIPAAGEFAYDPVEVQRDLGDGASDSENVHTFSGAADWTVSVDDLEASLPNIETVSLVVSWFGSDLRADQCLIQPKVDSTTKVTRPVSWQVAGLTRGTAQLVSQVDGRPAFGGTPSDHAVVAAIVDLRARGKKVTFYPFLLMDVAAANGLPNPYGGVSQPAYPWRGRITCHPAAGQPDSPDKSAAAATQVAALVGTAQPSDFEIAGGAVNYAGPAEWSLRRMVLHYAHLCVAAGGVDNFIISSELAGLTTVRSSASTYPFVNALAALASDVKLVLGAATNVTYAADWSEYFGHHPQDGSNDIYFHLDALWSSPAIDAIGIDLYWPLADWRDGSDHLDLVGGAISEHDLAYLKSNVGGGEGFDWYYASAEHRLSQTRTPITDGAGKPWVFRYKDIKSWWQSPHFDRPGGSESLVPTAWVPQSKPFWFTETGCPAVSRGANQPNVFFDPKSSESVLPYFSRGVSDDLIQQRYLQAILEVFDHTHPDHVAGQNPVSVIDGRRMVDLANIAVYTWDARPFPAFPQATDVWSDGSNWRFGHWLSGRTTSTSVARVISAILDDYGFSGYSVAGLSATIDGYLIDRPMTARSALQPLELAFAIDAVESGGIVSFRQRSQRRQSRLVELADCVELAAGQPIYRLTRAHETELPVAARLQFVDGDAGYRIAAVEERRNTAQTVHVAAAELPLVITSDLATGIVMTMLREALAARETLKLSLPPSALSVEPSDLLTIDFEGSPRLFRVSEIADGVAKEIEAVATDPGLFEAVPLPQRQLRAVLPQATGPAEGIFLDLPALSTGSVDPIGYLAANQEPWPGGVAFFRSAGSSGYLLDQVVQQRARVGRTLSPLWSGVTDLIDRANQLDVSMASGTLQSANELQVLEGANAVAIESTDGEWEVVQFLDAELLGAGIYRLSGLLRGQLGTESAMRNPLAASARVVVLDSSVAAARLGPDDIGRALNWQYGPASRPLGHPTYQSVSRSFRGIALRPFSPVHVRSTREAGDVIIHWTRRSRLDGDSWEVAEVPLAEDLEHYEVDILDGTMVRRVLSAALPTVTYTAAQQTADWGTAQPGYAVRVMQMSSRFGRGSVRMAIV